jgi:hypothetical protein
VPCILDLGQHLLAPSYFASAATASTPGVTGTFAIQRI